LKKAKAKINENRKIKAPTLLRWIASYGVKSGGLFACPREVSLGSFIECISHTLGFDCHHSQKVCITNRTKKLYSINPTSSIKEENQTLKPFSSCLWLPLGLRGKTKARKKSAFWYTQKSKINLLK
jgi:hypothetical protein